MSITSFLPMHRAGVAGGSRSRSPPSLLPEKHVGFSLSILSPTIQAGSRLPKKPIGQRWGVAAYKCKILARISR